MFARAPLRSWVGTGGRDRRDDDGVEVDYFERRERGFLRSFGGKKQKDEVASDTSDRKREEGGVAPNDDEPPYATEYGRRNGGEQQVHAHTTPQSKAHRARLKPRKPTSSPSTTTTTTTLVAAETTTSWKMKGINNALLWSAFFHHGNARIGNFKRTTHCM